MVLGLEDGQPLPAWLTDRIDTLTTSLRKLARAPQPWPPELVRDVSAAARQAIGGGPVAHVDRVPTVSAILRATGRDLAAVVDPRTGPLLRLGS
jgi:hypothetical protein